MWQRESQSYLKKFGDGQLALNGDRHRKTGSKSPVFVTRWHAEFLDEASRTELLVTDSGHVTVGLNITDLRPAAAEPAIGQVARKIPPMASTASFRCTRGNLPLWTGRGTL